MTYGTYASYQAVLQEAEMVPVADSVEKLRLIKSSEEIKILEEAAKIADDAFEHILTFIKPGISEISVANELEFYMRRQGADGSSFDMIVASGVRSSLPHGVASGKLIEKETWSRLISALIIKAIVLISHAPLRSESQVIN